MPATLVDSHCHLDFPDFAGRDPGRRRPRPRRRRHPHGDDLHPPPPGAAGPRHRRGARRASSGPPAPTRCTPPRSRWRGSTSSPPWPRTRSSSASARPASTTTTPPRAPPCSRRACASTSRPPAPPRSPSSSTPATPTPTSARILAEEHAAGPFACVMHCFTTGAALAETALSLGFYLSISGIATFRSAEALRAIFAAAPRDRLLVETDSPYLAPAAPPRQAQRARLHRRHRPPHRRPPRPRPGGVRRPHHRQLRPPLPEGRRMKPARPSCRPAPTATGRRRAATPSSLSGSAGGVEGGRRGPPSGHPRAAGVQGHKGADGRPGDRARACGRTALKAPTPACLRTQRASPAVRKPNGKPTFQPHSSRFPAPENPSLLNALP